MSFAILCRKQNEKGKAKWNYGCFGIFRQRAEILNWLNREEKDLSIPLSYTLLSNAVLLVEEGLGCAFCLDGALAIHSSPNLRFIPIHPEHTTRSVLIWKKNHLFSPVTSLFIQEINMLRAGIGADKIPDG